MGLNWPFRILLFGLLIGVALLLTNLLLGKNAPQEKVGEGVEKIDLPTFTGLTEKSPIPTPFLFQDMTLPYLRGRGYQSSITIVEEINKNASYTSYLVYYDSDGLKVYGQLTRPSDEVPEGGWPAVVFVHGYIPPENYKTLVNYASHVDSLARAGLVVFKIDLRGHGNSEGEAGGGYYAGDYVIDTLNAKSALANMDYVNPKKIGLWGHSMAGNVVFRSWVAKSQEIPKVVIWAGAGYTYTDLQSYMISDSSYRPPATDSERAKKRQLLIDTYGSFNPNHWFWQQVPATNYLSGVNGEINIHHAVNDNVVSIEYSRNLAKVLKDQAINHKVFEYASGGHNLTGDSFSFVMQRTAEFFKDY